MIKPNDTKSINSIIGIVKQNVIDYNTKGWECNIDIGNVNGIYEDSILKLYINDELVKKVVINQPH